MSPNGKDIFGIEVLSDRLCRFDSLEAMHAIDVKSTILGNYIAKKWPCMKVFVNIERKSIGFNADIISSMACPGMVFEITERNINLHHDETLRFCRLAKESGALIALDDVTQIEDSRVDIETINPEFIKTNQFEKLEELKFKFPDKRIIMECIEKPKDHLIAVKLKADFLQGFLFWKNDNKRKYIHGKKNRQAGNCPILLHKPYHWSGESHIGIYG